MFGLVLTLCGSVLLAVMVAIRNKKQIEELTNVVLPVFGKVNPKILDILKETYLFRTGLLYISIGVIFQIFPELDMQIASMDILLRLVITLVGFYVILSLSYKIIVKIAKRNFNKFPPYSPHSNASIRSIVIDNQDE